MNFFKVSKFFLFIAPFAVVVVTTTTLFPFIVGKYTFFKVVIELALIAFVLGWGFAGDDALAKKVVSKLKNPLVLAVTFFVFIFTLSGFTGVNPSASFWSNFERGEGSFLMLHFYIFFLLLSFLMDGEKDWKRIFKLSLFAGCLMIAYGVMTWFGVSGFFGGDLCSRFAGSLGNAAYVGTYSIFALFYTAYLMATGNWLSRKWRKIWLPLLALLLLLFFSAIIMSQTRGALFGLGAGLVIGLSYLATVLKSKKIRIPIISLIAFMVIVGGLGIYYRQSIDLLPFCKEQGGGNRLLDVSLTGETINTRLVLWGQAIAAFKERPLLGWGPENFSIAFERHYNTVHTVWFDRAHNIFFDYLVFSGILGLLSFLGIFLIFYWALFRHKKMSYAEAIAEKNEKSKLVNYQMIVTRALLLSLPIAYLIQGLVLFDVLPIYINLFLFLAFSGDKFTKEVI